MAYIYMIENDINDKKYIGKTTNTMEYRFKQHLNDAFKRTEEQKNIALYIQLLENMEKNIFQ